MSWSIFFFAAWWMAAWPGLLNLDNSVPPIGVGLLYWMMSLALERWKSSWQGMGKHILRVLMLIGAGAVAMANIRQSFRLEDAVTFLIFLPIIKNMEINSVRDRRIQVLLLVLVLNASLLLVTQLYWMLWALGFGVVALLALCQCDRPGPQLNWSMWRQQATLALALLPLVGLFFVLFPRLQFYGRIQWPQAKSGISNELKPGDMASMAMDDQVFATILEEGPANDKTIEYWRYSVLTHTRDGLRWDRKSPRPWTWINLTPDNVERYQVFYQQPGEHLLIHREGTQTLVPNGRINMHRLRDGTFSALYFQGKNPIYTGYDVAAIDTIAPSQDMLQLPQLEQDFLTWANSTNAALVVEERLKRHLQEGFSYDLNPGTYQTMAQFALSGKKGYCEHFAALAATLLRLWNIPSRVVVGFLVFRPSDIRSYSILNSDAHAWVEYWSEPEQRWQRYDPVADLAPDRLLGSARGWRERRDGQSSAFSQWWQQGFLAAISGHFRSLYLKTNLWMLSYDREEQRRLFRLEQSQLRHYGPWLAGLVFLVIASLVIGHFLMAPRQAFLTRAWLQLLQKRFPQLTPWQRLQLTDVKHLLNGDEDWAQELIILQQRYFRLRFGADQASRQQRLELKQSMRAFISRWG